MPGAKLRFDADGQRGFLHALVNLEQMRVRFADADPDNFRRAFEGNTPTPFTGRKNAPNPIALSFSRSLSSISSGTSPKKPSVRCIWSGSVQRTPRMSGSRSASNWRVESGRSIATKSRLLISKKVGRPYQTPRSAITPIARGFFLHCSSSSRGRPGVSSIPALVVGAPNQPAIVPRFRRTHRGEPDSQFSWRNR